jgi:hypothetical protein
MTAFSSSRARLAVLFVAGALSLVVPRIASAEECTTAQKAFECAQQALSKAMRDAVTSADAYSQCMSSAGAKGCGGKKALYDAARAAKAKATSALKDATAKQHSLCH